MSLITDELVTQYNQVLAKASAFIHRHKPLSIADELDSLRQATEVNATRDTYGKGGVTAAFEDELSELFQKPDCLFLPTGTLAQCAAMKCYSELTGRRGVALHPTSHLLLHEYMAVEKLWGLSATPVGQAERVMTAADLTSLDPECTSALIVELPMREIGGALPAWNELLAIREWCDKHAVFLHADGARLWQTTTFYQRPLADIAALFDSVYVSFYKDLGGIAGAALLGSQQLISEARIWARRAGGNPITQYPDVLAARTGLHHYLPQMAHFTGYTGKLCAELASLPLTIDPEHPQAAMFHMHFHLSPDALTEKIVRYARKTGIVVLPLPRAGGAEHSICEISVGDRATSHSPGFWRQHLSACLEQQ